MTAGYFASATTIAIASPVGETASLDALGVLVVAEIAMATVLFVSGGLMIHSFVRLTNVNPGFDPRGVVTFQISLSPERSVQDLRTLARLVLERLQDRSDVRAIGYAEALPMTRVSMRFAQLGVTPPKGRPQVRPVPGSLPPEMPDARLVSRDFLKAMGIPLISGRAFGDDDRAGAPQVLLINRTLARSGFLGTNPVGTRVYARGPSPGRSSVSWTTFVRSAWPSEWIRRSSSTIVRCRQTSRSPVSASTLRFVPMPIPTG